VIIEIETPHGPARAHIQRVEKAGGLLVLGHGAGGGVDTPDLSAAARAANSAGFTAVLVEQPYRVAGRRSQPPAKQLDSAWVAALRQLRDSERPHRRLIVGGRSAGARVACRTAIELEADAVLCLAFPVHPPGKANDPSKSRLPELDAVRVPALVVQGDRDPFGRPPPRPGRRVVVVPGTHSLKSASDVERAIEGWLQNLVESNRRPRGRTAVRSV
jgi:predicted alpha/beta-hydrolase family hydrolase